MLPIRALGQDPRKQRMNGVMQFLKGHINQIDINLKWLSKEEEEVPNPGFSDGNVFCLLLGHCELLFSIVNIVTLLA